ncbi:hypothetical protein N656DRAFT_367924 [Canariomyces notabilis]|uniref:C2H2-type domain-containing protein n=1 Tax=Canariomyces notabilis TaxID=2074819 RepID=A0AAN6QHN6_9PEZI|nr:hypothetical protein N656DRAFT_367924 [Canariomyces arenarius]
MPGLITDTCREFKQEILNAIHESKHTKTTFLDAERVDQAATRACEEEASDELGLAEQNSTSAHGVSILAVEHHHDDSETAMGPLLSLSKPDNAAADCEPEVADGDTHSSTDLQLQRLNMSDFEVIQAISDDSLMKIAAHMQLQKSVAAFALNTMNRRPIEHSLSPEPTSSQADPAEDSATEAVESPESPDSDDSSSMRSWSTSTAGTKAEKGRYCCLIPGCGKILNRLADLNRHYKTVHLLPQGGSPPLEDLGRRRERRAAAQGVEEMREGARQLRLYKSLYEQMRSDYENLKRQMKHRESDAADSEDAPLLETKIQKAREVANQDTEKENKELMEWKEAWEWAERFRTGNLTEREENLLWLLETTGELYR